MKITLNTNLINGLFNGTYGNIWGEITEYDDNNNELSIDYKFDDLMKSIIRAYQSQEDNILRDINIKFITKLHFLDSYYSPREYNFSTDTLDLELEIDTTLLHKTLESLKHDAKFEQFLHDTYTSCDGFISFTPDNYKDLHNEIVTSGKEYDQALGALISYLINKNSDDTNVTNTIEMDVYEYWHGNGYLGLEYTTKEVNL